MNNRTKYIFISLIAFTVVLNSCDKEPIEKAKTGTNSSSSEDVKCVDGILEFSSQENFHEIIGSLNSMAPDELGLWESSVGFVSQRTVLNQINEAEIEYFEEIYKGIPEDISIQELEKRGLKSKHTDIYYQYLKSGLIKRTEDAEGYESIDLNLINPTYACVINSDGLVVVNDTICQYKENELKLLTTGERSDIGFLKNAFVADKAGSIIIFNYDDDKSIHILSEDAGHKYDNGKRFNLIVHGYSSATETLLSSSFYLESKGEVLRWGNYVYSNSYSPIYKIIGNWKYRYMIWYANHSITKTALYDSSTKSPFNILFNGTNHVLMNLSPSGYFPKANWYTFFDAVEVWNYHFDGDFFYGSHGLHITYDENNP